MLKSDDQVFYFAIWESSGLRHWHYRWNLEFAWTLGDDANNTILALFFQKTAKKIITEQKNDSIGIPVLPKYSLIIPGLCGKAENISELGSNIIHLAQLSVAGV